MYLPEIVRPLLVRPAALLGMVGIPIGLIGGFLVIVNPLYFAAAFVAIVVTVFFFIRFEQTLMALLVIRSGLDLFSQQGLPAAFALGLDVLVLSYVIVLYLTKQKIFFDKLFLVFAVWVIVQGLWPVLTAIGGLGLSSAYLSDSVREWVRMFSWLMVYLAVCQLRRHLRPEQVIDGLFLALVAPLFVATLQMTLPTHVLPSFLQTVSGTVFEAGSRINGTLGHPNTFVSFLIMFIGLTYWKADQAERSAPWFLLLLVEVFFLVSTKALVGLPMLAVLFLVLIITQLDIRNIVFMIVIFALLIALFMSTEFGRERLSSILETPLLNPDLTVNRAVLMSWHDANSFNWRLAQWTFLIEEWKRAPLLGYGMDLAAYIGPVRARAHNDYVRVLVEQGIVGIFFFLVFYIAQFVYLTKLYFTSMNASNKKFCLSLIAILASTLTGMLTENIWSHTTFFMYWWTLLCVAGWDWTRLDINKANLSITCDA
jgi:O-antigen ligase